MRLLQFGILFVDEEVTGNGDHYKKHSLNVEASTSDSARDQSSTDGTKIDHQLQYRRIEMLLTQKRAEGALLKDLLCKLHENQRTTIENTFKQLVLQTVTLCIRFIRSSSRESCQ